MTAPLPLPAQLLLVKWLTDQMAAHRHDDLLPQSAAEMPAGSRIPVMFGGKLAGWASMPQPSKKSAYVSDGKALLAWAEKHYPAHVGDAVSVAVDDDLLAFLQDNYPQALRTERQVDPQWVADIQGALKERGYYVTSGGEKLTEVPGITLPDPEPASPRINLEDNASEVIGDAWRAGLIALPDVLALPAGSAEADA